MTWLWKDKKTEQLKATLNQAFDEDKSCTTAKLTSLKNDARDFKAQLKTTSKSIKLTHATKNRRELLESLEAKTTDLQGKIVGLRHWNVLQLAALEKSEAELEASIAEVSSKQLALKEKADSLLATCEEKLAGGGRRATQLETGHVGSHHHQRAKNSECGPTKDRQSPTLTGWSTDDERIFAREAAKINNKWAAANAKKTANNESGQSNAQTDWWHRSETLRNAFIHKVWAATSGSVNTFEAVERHAIAWVKSEDAKAKRRRKAQKWRELQTKEKDERQRALRENVHECHDCEKKLVRSLRSSDNRAKLAEWKQIKAMKEELRKADDLVTAVKRIEETIVHGEKPVKTRMRRPKSGKNVLKTEAEAAEPALTLTRFERKKLLASFQQRDQAMVQKKLEMKMNAAKPASPDLGLKTPKLCLNIETEANHFQKPTFASLRKLQVCDDDPSEVFGYDFAPELESKLLQIENIPRLGMPTWRSSDHTR